MHRLLPALLLLAACASTDATVALNTPIIDTLPGGVVQVTNPGPTAWADTSGWRVVLEREIIPEEGSEGEVHTPSAVVAAENGTIYWLMSSPSVIKAYAPDGTWLRNIGREGDGPGEFHDGMFGVLGDKLLVQDPSNSRLTIFDTTGTLLGAHPSLCCHWTNTLPIFADETVGISGPPPGDDNTQGGALYRTRFDGSPVDTIVFPRPEPSSSRHWTVMIADGNRRTQRRMGIPLQPSDVSRYRRDATTVQGNTLAYALAITTLQGDTLRTFSAPAPEVTITTAQRDSIYEATVARMGERWIEAVRATAKPGDIPTTWPRWSTMAVQPSGHVWVARPNPSGGAPLLDVFTPEGILLGSVQAPHEAVINGYWTEDRVYVRGETDEGYPRIMVYRIERGGG